uniref:Ketoreductase domain-containing protein n=1 Tax=Alexandrium monilatum TaxID=311494 RepID=A0A7S4R8A5_9DINO
MARWRSLAVALPRAGALAPSCGVLAAAAAAAAAARARRPTVAEEAAAPASTGAPGADGQQCARHRRRLAGRVCLVTGGASGIGKAICAQLAREGARVAVLDVRRTPREGGDDVFEAMRAARRLEGLPVEPDLFVEGSVADAAAVASVVEAVLERFGRLDVLVNNAALMGGRPLLETSEEEWDRSMATNTKGVFLCTKAAVSQFLRQDRREPDGIRGRVVNVSSQHGMLYCPGNVAYGTSKAAVAYMTRQIGCEYIREGVVVNAVAPGRILTGRAGSRLDAQSAEEEGELQASFARTPHGALRLGTPEDVARAVAFLASDEASFIVGENLMVDGGYAAS